LIKNGQGCGVVYDDPLSPLSPLPLFPSLIVSSSSLPTLPSSQLFLVFFLPCRLIPPQSAQLPSFSHLIMTTTMTRKTFTPRPSLSSIRSSQSIICNSDSSSSRHNMATSLPPPGLTHAPMLPNEVLDLVGVFSYFPNTLIHPDHPLILHARLDPGCLVHLHPPPLGLSHISLHKLARPIPIHIQRLHTAQKPHATKSNLHAPPAPHGQPLLP